MTSFQIVSPYCKGNEDHYIFWILNLPHLTIMYHKETLIKYKNLTTTITENLGETDIPSPSHVILNKCIVCVRHTVTVDTCKETVIMKYIQLKNVTLTLRSCHEAEEGSPLTNTVWNTNRFRTYQMQSTN